MTPPNGLDLTIWFGRGNLGKLTVGGHPDVIPSILKTGARQVFGEWEEEVKGAACLEMMVNMKKINH